ncbi:MAG: peptidylprolyl isomerase [Chloroflexi bacterium]|nr:peptidylprolyl isomerase [Chloroflexota bacterium]
MAVAKNGDNVQVHYTGRLDDGTIFDSSEGGDPLAFQLGARAVIPGFEAAIVGMQEGHTKTTHIPAAAAYGPYLDEMVLAVSRDQFPPDLEPQVGQPLQIEQEDGQTFVAHIAEISEAAITLDANHPLAGQDLTFDIQLVKIG